MEVVAVDVQEGLLNYVDLREREREGEVLGVQLSV